MVILYKDIDEITVVINEYCGFVVVLISGSILDFVNKPRVEDYRWYTETHLTGSVNCRRLP